jgi:hypothetical protein
MIWADSGLVKMFCAKSASTIWALVRVIDCSEKVENGLFVGGRMIPQGEPGSEVRTHD